MERRYSAGLDSVLFEDSRLCLVEMEAYGCSINPYLSCVIYVIYICIILSGLFVTKAVPNVPVLLCVPVQSRKVVCLNRTAEMGASYVRLDWKLV